MTACHLKDQVSPYILTVAHSCNDFGVISHVPAKNMKLEWGNRFGGGVICQCTQKRMGRSCVPIAYKVTSWIAGVLLG